MNVWTLLNACEEISIIYKIERQKTNAEFKKNSVKICDFIYLKNKQSSRYMVHMKNIK